MDDCAIYMRDLLHHGAVAVVSVVSGSACPCIDETGSYDAQWHRDYPAPGNEDCGGTELISRSTANTNVKALFTNKLQSLASVLNKALLKEIGEIVDADLFMFGTVTVADLSFYDLGNLDEKRDYVTVFSKVYKVRQPTYDVMTDVVVGQVGLLKRKS